MYLQVAEEKDLGHGQGGVQGRVEGAEGQNLEGRACGSLQGNEYSGRRLRGAGGDFRAWVRWKSIGF